MADIEIVSATGDDVDVLRNFIVDLAVYQNTGDQVTITADDLKRDGFSDGGHKWYRAIFAKVDGLIVGHALFFTKFSLQTMRKKMYLEDIYVVPDWRTKGAGKLLWASVCAEAIKSRCYCLELCVLSWNKSAVDFYEGKGATSLPRRHLLFFDRCAIQSKASSS